MLTAFFDASGSEDDPQQPVFLVAGFAARVEDWVDFDRIWGAELRKYNLPYFHTWAFAHFEHPFDAPEWKDESRRRSLYGSLLDIIKSHVYRKFGSGVSMAPFKAVVPNRVKLAFHLSAYSLTGRAAAQKVYKWWCVQDGMPDQIEYVFEDGDLGKGKLIKRLQADGYGVPVFKPKKDTVGPDGKVVKGYTPLQAADILCYETVLPYRKVQCDEVVPNLRWGFKQLETIPGDVGVFTVGNLAKLKELESRDIMKQ
jgi:hypothetical protein